MKILQSRRLAERLGKIDVSPSRYPYKRASILVASVWYWQFGRSYLDAKAKYFETEIFGIWSNIKFSGLRNYISVYLIGLDGEYIWDDEIMIPPYYEKSLRIPPYYEKSLRDEGMA